MKLYLHKSVIFKKFLILFNTKPDTYVIFYKFYDDFIWPGCYDVLIRQFYCLTENTE